MKRPEKRNSIFPFLSLLIFLIPSFTFAGDVPVDRDFMRLPDQRWIWLEKTGWHTTRIILGKGKKSFKNRIWSEVRETDGTHTWAYAFFVRIHPNQFISFDVDKNPAVAVSTYDMGNNVIRYAIIYRVKADRLEVVREVPGFNAAADGSVLR